MISASEAVANIRAEYPNLSLNSMKILARWFHNGDQTQLCTSPPHHVLSSQYGGLDSLFALQRVGLIVPDTARERSDRGIHAYVGTDASRRLGGPLWNATMRHVMRRSALDPDGPREPDYGVTS